MTAKIVGSRDIAEKAAEEFVGPGARNIYRDGKVIGKIVQMSPE